MEITTQYIISQIIIIFVYIFLGLTYCIKSRKIILLFSFLSNFLSSISFVLLSAYTSAVMCIVSIVRDIIFMIDEKINGKSEKITKKDIIILACIYGISLISVIFTFKAGMSILYTLGTMLYTYSIWQKNNKIYRFFGIIVALIVIFDSIYIKSISGVILQTIILISSTIGYISSTKTKEKLDTLNNINKNTKYEVVN